MFCRSRLFIALFGLAILRYMAWAQTPAATKPDYSKEAFVIEQSTGQIAFENDGTGTRESTARIRIQSDAGVQRYGLLTFSYQSAFESLDIDYVRVIKPGGEVVATPADDAQDMASAITREAPSYSDIREKHLAVKGLGVGDLLEFHTIWHSTKALAPGQFWYAYNFSHDGIILQETLRISVPRDRQVKWKSPAVKPAIADEQGRRTFTWTTSQLEHQTPDQDKADKEEKLYQLARGKLPPPEVQISSFQKWEDVGRWYNDLQQDKVKPTAEIIAKAAQLTKGAADDDAKTRAIYKYVSTEFRYIGVALGIGRYQPHTAAEVLANQYGDCKDKHTLLASLLSAASIKAYPALINSTHDTDLDVPSPAQFDHVITAVPWTNGFLWLDTTAEVAPFGYILSPLLNKQALVMSDGKPPALVATPAESPTKAMQTFKIDAKLSDDGTLEGKVERTDQGNDMDVVLRSGFRRLPMAQWKELVQQISSRSGFSGDVSEVTTSQPTDIDQPFRISYVYKRKDFPDWPNRRVAAALPVIALPETEIDGSTQHPTWLGQPEEKHFIANITLPDGYRLEPKRSVDVSYDFAEYHSSSAFRKGVLTVKRDFASKLTEIPQAENKEYADFIETVSNDRGKYNQLSSGPEPAQQATRQGSFRVTRQEIMNLPDSSVAEASRKELDSRALADADRTREAIVALQNALAIDPSFTRGWMEIGALLLTTHQIDAASEAYRKATECDPKFALAHKMLAFSLIDLHKLGDAVGVLQKVVELAPGDFDGPGNLGRVLAKLGRYGESITAFEAALNLNPDHAVTKMFLGISLLQIGEHDRGLNELTRALEIDPSADMLNSVAYELAKAGKELPLALKYAERAVKEEEQRSDHIRLSSLRDEDLELMEALANDWDTLGWVHFCLGNNGRAEKFLVAAWELSQGYEQADHLGQLYEKQGMNEAATRMYRMALASSLLYRGENESLPRIRNHLRHLHPSDSESELVSAATGELTAARTLAIPHITKETASADFCLLVGPKSRQSKFIAGSEALQSAERVLDKLQFHLSVPEDSEAHVLRRGTLSCDSSNCSFVLYPSGRFTLD